MCSIPNRTIAYFLLLFCFLVIQCSVRMNNEDLRGRRIHRGKYGIIEDERDRKEKWNILDEEFDFSRNKKKKDIHVKSIYRKLQGYEYERDRNYILIRNLLINNRFRQAEETLLVFSAKYPDKKDKEYYYYFGIINENKKEYIKAAQSYLKAIKICPEYSRARNNLGHLYFKMRRFPEAEEQFLKASQANPYNPFIHFNIGNFYFNTGNYDKAVKYLNNAIKYKANFCSAFHKLGIIMYQQKRYSDAILFFHRVVQFKKESHITYFYMGLSYDRLEDRELAISSLEKSVSLKSDFFEALVELGKIYHAYGEFANAINCYEKAELINQDYKELKIWIAECYGELKRYKKAIVIVKGLLKKEPHNERFLDLLRYLEDKKNNKNLNQDDDYLNF